MFMMLPVSVIDLDLVVLNIPEIAKIFDAGKELYRFFLCIKIQYCIDMFERSSYYKRSVTHIEMKFDLISTVYNKCVFFS